MADREGVREEALGAGGEAAAVARRPVGHLVADGDPADRGGVGASGALVRDLFDGQAAGDDAPLVPLGGAGDVLLGQEVVDH